MNATQSLTATSPNVRPAWRSIGVWMAALIVGYCFFNVVRAILNPVDFASTFGTPLVNNEDTSFVMVYAIRTLFLGLFGLSLLVRRDYKALSQYALIGVVMPLGDALLVASAGGATSIVVRHVLVAVFLFVTWFMLRRWVQVNVKS